MKKKLAFSLIPLMALIMTGCVMYNGQGKPGTKSSAAPSSGEPGTSSVEPTSSGEPMSSLPSSSSDAGPASSSSTPTPTPTPEPVSGEDLPAGTAVKVYLVFGEYGKYKGNLVNTGVESLFLEHTIEYSAKVGEDLPGKADVTSTVEGSEFVAWTSYNNDGKLTEYTKVPGRHDKILYASFSGGNGQGGGQTPTPTPDPDPTPTPSDEKVTVTLNVTYDAGMGVGVYLVGDFCEWSPANNNVIKFNWTEGNVWTATKEVYKDTTYRCKLVTAPYEFPSQVYTWEKDGADNERVITFSKTETINLEWGNY